MKERGSLRRDYRQWSSPKTVFELRLTLAKYRTRGLGNVTLWASIELHRLGHRNRDLRWWLARPGAGVRSLKWALPNPALPRSSAKSQTGFWKMSRTALQASLFIHAGWKIWCWHFRPNEKNPWKPSFHPECLNGILHEINCSIFILQLNQMPSGHLGFDWNRCLMK